MGEPAFAPYLPAFGFGAAAGLAVAYAAKKLTKAAAIILGSAFILLQGMAYLGWLTMDWGAVEAQTIGLWRHAAGDAPAAQCWQILVANVPFAGGFGTGFTLGFKAG